jgi:hypothetical protein
MPRPKRTKVAPSVPAPRTRKPAKSTPQAEPAAQLPKADFDDLYDVSDSDERSRAKLQSSQKAQLNQGAGVTGLSAATRKESAKDAQEAKSASPTTQRIAEALGILGQDSSSPEIETGRRERATPGIESSVLAISKFKRRPRQPSILGGGPSRARSSSIESDMADDDGPASATEKNNSMLRSGSLKRRREGSVSARVDAPTSNMALHMGTPARIGSAMKIANFKRRAREPSILGTAQKAKSQQVLYDDNDDDDAEEEEDDFNPDDESTPLNLSKNKTMTASSASSSLNTRKRKLSVVQVPQSSPTLPSPRAFSPEEAIPSTEQDIFDEPGSEPDEGAEPDELPLPSIENRPRTPEIFSETMAPPRSSSSSLPSPQMPSRTRRAPIRGRRNLRDRTPPPRTQDSPISSPPSLTHSPNRPSLHPVKSKPKNAGPLPSTLSTAQLQALLPRRRRRPVHDTFSLPTSEDEASNPDDDELSTMSVRPRSRRGVLQTRTTVPVKKGATKGKQVPKVKESLAKRTYGSRANPTSDKENHGEVDIDDSLGPLPDDGENQTSENSQEMEQRIGKELKRAAKKFKEVDKWELEFEEVTASSASPKDAR